MFKSTLICVALLLAFCATIYSQQASQNWAVLVAGSNGYYNYRHQSDICHAYHILSKNGIPDSNIIVMMYDDIANSKSNPKPGSIINEPNGPNVYPGTIKDYTGEDVTPENFLKILQGADMSGIGSGKTLKSGPNDNVFIYFADHGGPGIIAFPGFKLLHANDLIATLKSMYTGNKYKQLVFYMEACESGSMFNNLLPTNWNIFATTASNPYQSSYACYYDATYQTYLADCYSINWMNDTDHSNINTETLQQQYNIVKKITTTSQVCEYGDLSISSQTLNLFQANKNAQEAKNTIQRPTPGNPTPVDSRDVKETYLTRRLQTEKCPLVKFSLEKELKEHMKQKARADVVFGSFKQQLNLRSVKEEMMKSNGDNCNNQYGLNADCMKASIQAAEKFCGAFDEHSIRYTDYIRDACDMYQPHTIAEKLQKICLSIPQL